MSEQPKLPETFGRDPVGPDVEGLFDVLQLRAEVARLTAREKQLVEALEEIKECMGGDGAEGWDSPEDVWKIANKALLGPPAGRG